MANLQNDTQNNVWLLKQENITENFVTVLRTANQYVDRNIKVDVSIKPGNVDIVVPVLNTTPAITGNQANGYVMAVVAEGNITANVTNGYINSVESKPIMINSSIDIPATKMSHAVSDDGQNFVTTASAGYNDTDITDSIGVYQGETTIE